MERILSSSVLVSEMGRINWARTAISYASRSVSRSVWPLNVGTFVKLNLLYERSVSLWLSSQVLVTSIAIMKLTIVSQETSSECYAKTLVQYSRTFCMLSMVLVTSLLDRSGNRLIMPNTLSSPSATSQIPLKKSRTGCDLIKWFLRSC